MLQQEEICISNRKPNIFPLFTVAMAFNCIAYSTVRNYAALFLQGEGFTNTDVGFFFSLGGAFSIVSQLTLGTLLDKQEKLTAKHILIAVTVLVCCDATLIYFSSVRSVMFWGFVVTNMIILLDKSLFNIFGLAYVDASYELDYSLSRGIGSFISSLNILLTGMIISRAPTKTIFIIFFIMQIGQLVALLRLPTVYRTSPEPVTTATADSTAADRPTIALSDRNLWILLVSMLLVYGCYNAGHNYHINIIEALGGTSRELGISEGIMSMVELPAMAAFLPLSKRFSYRQILCFSLVCFVAKVVCFAFATNVVQLYVVQILQLFSFGLFIPASAFYMNDILGETQRGRGQALLAIFTSGLSGLLTSPIVGLILDHFSIKTMLLVVSAVACVGIVGSIFATRAIEEKLGD